MIFEYESYKDSSDEMLAIINAYISVCPDSSNGYIVRGFYNEMKGYYDKAIKDYNKAVQIENDNYFYYILLAQAEWENDDNLTALLTIDLAIMYKPTDAYSYYIRGNIYNSSQQYDLALDDINKAIELDENIISCHYLRPTLILFVKKDFDAAIESLNNSINLFPNNSKLYADRARFYCVKRELELALSDASKAIELEPEDGDAYTIRALIYYHMGKYADAYKDADKGVKLNPQESFSYYMRGLVKIGSGEINSGCEDLKKAGTLKSENPLMNQLKEFFGGFYDNYCK